MYSSINKLANHKAHFQIAIFSLAFFTLILAIVRLALPGSIPNRMDIWVLVVCIKSIAIMTYEVLTERVTRLQRRRSTKANMILNCIEPIFWFAAFVFSTMGVSRRCVAASCGVSIVIMLVVLVLAPLSLCLAVVSAQEHRDAKRGIKVQISRKGQGV